VGFVAAAVQAVAQISNIILLHHTQSSRQQQESRSNSLRVHQLLAACWVQPRPPRQRRQRTVAQAIEVWHSKSSRRENNSNNSERAGVVGMRCDEP